MNTLIFISALISFFAVLGHFSMGAKMYLKPVKESGIDEIPIKVMESLFHYMSVFMLLTTFVLAYAAFCTSLFGYNLNAIVLFIGITYGGFAIVQFAIALFSSIKMGIGKMFQWVFWLAISVFSILGSV